MEICLRKALSLVLFHTRHLVSAVELLDSRNPRDKEALCLLPQFALPD